MQNKYRVRENKRLHGIYHGIKRRCLNRNEPRYVDYGGRGIKMCDEWLKGFDEFAEWALQNGYEDGLSIERKDVDGDYCPNNCEWITMERQSFNKRTTVFVTYKGETKCLKDWCNELNLTYDTLNNRIKKGWSPEDAFEKPTWDYEKSFSRLCKQNGLNPTTVKSRVDKFGWSMERALNTPSDGRGANYGNYGSKIYGTDKCKVCGAKFERHNHKQLYCGAECNIMAKKIRYMEKKTI